MPGQAWTSLGYEYEPPRVGYSANAGWNGWDLAMAQYGGGRRGAQGRGFERDWFDGVVSRLPCGFATVETYLMSLVVVVDRSMVLPRTLPSVDSQNLKHEKHIAACTTCKNQNAMGLTISPLGR